MNIKAMAGTPPRPDPSKPGLGIPIKIRFDEPLQVDPDKIDEDKVEPGTRRMRLTKAMLGKYGYTDGCDGCRVQKAGLAQPGHPHSEACRSRIEAAMAKDDQGKEKLRKVAHFTKNLL